MSEPSKKVKNSFNYDIPFDWTPSYEDIQWGKVLLMMENHNPRSLPVFFSAMSYCILTLREKFAINKEMHDKLIIADLVEADDILKRPDDVKTILSPYGFGKRKADLIINTASKWKSLDIEKRIKEDEFRENGFEIRKLMVDNFKGIGYKLCSLPLRIAGYENTIPVDSSFQAYLEAKDYVFQKPLASGKPQGLKPPAYLEYERVGSDIAYSLGLMPVLLQASVYAKWTTWKKDSRAQEQIGNLLHLV